MKNAATTTVISKVAGQPKIAKLVLDEPLNQVAA
jgi:hypothetical protein